MPAIFVETYIRADIDRVWELTQDPELHQRWDLRFTEISYLPKEEGEPQRFLYKTNIGFGMPIAGEGESVGVKNSEGGTRTSALKFWSKDRRFRIDVNVSNRRWGPLFGYSGWFQNEVVPVETTPADVLPRRVERRE